MRLQTDIQPSYVMGHSLGEITAYYAAGVFDLETALGVIQARGQAMLEACNTVPSEMAAVMGLDLDTIQLTLAPFRDAPVVAANINSPNQIVISGASAHLPAAIEALKAAGAKRVIPLPVAGAFHSPLMQSASEKLKTYLDTVTFNAPTIPIVLNRSARPTLDLNEIKQNLPLQVVSSVRWVESVAHMAEDPACKFIECGPGNVLAGLIKKIAPDSAVCSIDSPQLETLATICAE